MIAGRCPTIVRCARFECQRTTSPCDADYSRCHVSAGVYSSGGPQYSQNGGGPISESTSLAPVEDPGAMQPASEVAGDGVTRVTFWLQYQAEFGQRICVVGNCVGLGMWHHKAAPEMQWNNGHQWSVTVEVPAGQILEYKYVVLQPDGLTALHWQSGNNAVLALMVRFSIPRSCKAHL
jgi:hypothetical protein